MTRLRFLMTLISLGALLASGAWAQRKRDKDENATTRSVQGVVRDAADASAAGAVVQLKDLKSLQVRSFITKQDGTYQFQGLSPNVDYELKADHQGNSSDVKTLSTFDSRRNAVINLKIEGGKQD